MAQRIMMFEAQIDNERAALAFAMRGTLVDFLRAEIRATMARAEDAEIDRETAMRRFAMTYSQTAKAYRLPRTVPTALVRWAIYVSVNSGRDGFVDPHPGTVATFSKESVTMLPGSLLLVKLGGCMFVGNLAGGIPEDLFEVRAHKDAVTGKYMVTFICGRPEGDSPEEAPVPVEPEDVDA